MSLVQINGRDMEWIACKKHVAYQDSGYVILTCSKCALRRIEEECARCGGDRTILGDNYGWTGEPREYRCPDCAPERQEP